MAALHKILTHETKSSIVHNPSTHVSGISLDYRRQVGHRQDLNEKTLSSLSAAHPNRIINRPSQDMPKVEDNPLENARGYVRFNHTD